MARAKSKQSRERMRRKIEHRKKVKALKQKVAQIKKSKAG